MAAYTFDNSVPPNTESPRNGATRIRNLAIAILSMLGLPNNAGPQTVAGPFISSFDASGNATFPVGTAVTADPALALGVVPKQYADAKTPYVLAAGGDAYTGTFADIPTLVNGQLVTVKFPAANTTTSPTFALNSTGAVPLATLTGASLAIGAIALDAVYTLVYDSATATWVIVGAANPQAGFPLTANASAASFRITSLGAATTAGDAVSLANIIGTSGEIELPVTVGGVFGNFRIQYGTSAPALVNSGATTQVAVSFPVAFTVSCYTVVVGTIATSGSGNQGATTCVESGSVTNSSFTLDIGNSSGSNHTIGAYWIAVGQ